MRFNRICFGLSNATQSLAGLLDKVVGVDLEPLVILTNSFEHHISLLREIAPRPNKSNSSKITYLGYVVNEYGLKNDRKKLGNYFGFPYSRYYEERS